MKPRVGLAGILSVMLALVVASIWVLIPAFPRPSALVGKPNSVLVSRLGPATSELPDKFVEWEIPRGVAIWTLEASYRAWPIGPGSIIEDVKRCLWIKWAGSRFFAKEQ